MTHAILTLVLALQAVLGEAHVEIDLGPDRDSALVTATYAFGSSPEPIRFTAIRLDEQSVEISHLSGTSPFEQVSTRKGLYEFTLPGTSAGMVEIQYRVEGDLTRIPLFVPDRPTSLDETRITIRVAGIGQVRSLTAAFPRAELGPDGTLVSRPGNLPSVVILPSRTSSLSLNRAADAAVVLTMVIASAWWLWRRRLFRIRPAPPDGRRPASD